MTHQQLVMSLGKDEESKSVNAFMLESSIAVVGDCKQLYHKGTNKQDDVMGKMVT